MTDKILEAAKLIKARKSVIALTGAGISVESGIPPFRGKGGLWEKFDPEEYANIDNFIKNPEKIWKAFLTDKKAVIDNAKPNDAHNGLFILEKMWLLRGIITSNIDGLHQAAGSKNVVEFHGTFATYSCLNCRKVFKSSEVKTDVIPPVCECGGTLRPNCIFFGEAINPNVLEKSRLMIAACNVLLVVGSSLVVTPSSLIPFEAKSKGAKIIEINTEPTSITSSITDIFIKEQAAKAINRLVSLITKNND